MRRTLLFLILAAFVLLIPVAVVISAPQAAWVKSYLNPVFRPNTSGTWDDSNVSAAKVIFDGAAYRMWYTANGANESKYRIGYASSPDGINWTRYYTPVLTQGTGFVWDAKGVSAPTVLYRDGLWRMWYVGYGQAPDDDVQHFSIGYATSADGLSWTKSPNNPVLEPSAVGADDIDVVSPNVLFKDGVYHMWYAGRGENNQIFYATSADGVQWTKDPNNPVLRLGVDLAWDNGEIAAPSVIWTGSQYDMWYQGYSRGTLFRYIGHATSRDGFTWTKDVMNPVLGLEPNTWDRYSVYYPSVVLKPDGELLMWYQGEAGPRLTKQIGLATFMLNAVPTPLPTFPAGTATPVPPTPTPGGPPTATPSPTATWTPIPVDCSAVEGKHCLLLPAIGR